MAGGGRSAFVEGARVRGGVPAYAPTGLLLASGVAWGGGRVLLAGCVVAGRVFGGCVLARCVLAERGLRAGASVYPAVVGFALFGAPVAVGGARALPVTAFLVAWDVNALAIPRDGGERPDSSRAVFEADLDGAGGADDVRPGA